MPPMEVYELRSDKQERHDRLCDLIRNTIAEDGREKDDYLWAVRSMDDWANMLGADKKTVERLCAEKPIQRLRTRVGGVSAVLLRIEAPGGDKGLEKQRLKLLARQMEKLFLAKISTKDGEKLLRVPENQFGQLNGLAERWPDGFQIAIMKHVLADWPHFMAGAKLHSAVYEDAHGIPDLLKNLFFTFPIIWPIWKYHAVAADSYLMHLQKQGGLPVPPYPYQIKDY
jgi:hypothetical protein